MKAPHKPTVFPTRPLYLAAACILCCAALSLLIASPAFWALFATHTNAGEPKTVAADKDPRHPEVEKQVRHYFTSWSNKDMEAYGACFADEAAIQLMHSQGLLSTQTLGPFLESQRDAHRNATSPLKEVPETIEIRFEGELARAVVYWKLTSGSRTEYGYDHFTLMKSKGQWKIVNLVFYATKSSR